MIDFQSSAMAKIQSYRPCHSPSPGGEGRGSSEYSERLTGCCSGVGELNHRGHQSALTKVGRVYSRAVLSAILSIPCISLPSQRTTHYGLFRPIGTYSRPLPPPFHRMEAILFILSKLCAFALFINPNQPLNDKIPALPTLYRPLPPKNLIFPFPHLP
jgi:hypothetical protein